MLYGFIRTVARAAIKLYCRDIRINKPGLFQHDGPLMLASNHPNSFLDAVILCTLFDRPVYSLARGDVFKSKLVSKLLYALKMLPVYRASEGVENLDGNYKTFDECKEIFKKNGIVLIFSEGKCINEWHLRPLRKGTARLAISSWLDDIPLKVLPVGINYSSFRTFGKNVHLYFGEFIEKTEIDLTDTDGKVMQAFNAHLQKQLAPFVYEIDKLDKQQLRKTFNKRPSLLRRILLFIPSLAGWLLHAPLYLPLKNYVTKKASDNDHFDSIIVGVLLLGYPLTVLLITFLTWMITGNWYAVFLILIFPLTAWSFIQLKKQVE